MENVVIIGSGLAGYTLAKELRKLAPALPIRILTLDDGASYSKPMLSNALAKGKTAQSLAMASAEQMEAQLNITITTHTAVTAIDTQAHTLATAMEEIPYGKLVLCVGAEPIRPPLAGDAADRVLSVNNLADYAVFRDALETAQRVAIIGPGLIGCEFANDLLSAGKQVAVIGPGAAPLDRLLPTEAGAALQKALARQGVTWHLGATALRVDRQDEMYRITLSDGATLHADCVLSAVGLRPNLQLAKLAGLQTARGIVVNRHLQTSAPDVYVLGDCAEVEGLVLPFVMPIMHAARALAPTLAGTLTAVNYPAMPVVVKTPACPVVVSPPAAGAAGEWHIEHVDDAGVRALYRGGDGRLLGFALTGAAAAERQTWSKELPPVLG